MWISTKQAVFILCCWILLGGDFTLASTEGETFFKALKSSKGVAFLVRLVDGALTEEVCQKIESSVKEEQVAADSGGNITVYTLDRSGRDPVTRDLQERYTFDTIPLGILIDEDGRPVGKTMITDDLKDNLIREIKRLRALKETRDKAFAESAKSQKGYSVQLLDQGLSILPKNELTKYYQKEVQQILKGDDPELVKKYQSILSEERDRSVVEGALERLRRKISGGNLDLNAIIAHLEEEKSKEGLTNEVRQKLEMHKFRYFAGSQNYEKALASLDEAFALAPKSELAGKIEGFRIRIQKSKTKQDKKTKESAPKSESN